MDLNVVETGAGNRRVLILHGLMGSARNWGGIAKGLAAAGDTRVMAMDLPNHGNSPWDDRLDYPWMAQRVGDWIDAQGEGAVDIIGHSMGGKVAMMLALSWPELVRSVVAADMAPVSYRHSFMPHIQAMRAVPLDQLARRSEADAILASHLDDAKLGAFLAHNLDVSPQGYRWRVNLDAIERNMSHILAFPDVAAGTRFGGPALFLSGAQSDYVRPSHRERILELFPHAQFEVLEGAGHWLHAEQPAAFVAAVRSFLG